jgi:MFS family permease
MSRKINKVILLLTLSDIFTWGPYTIIAALAGLYLANKLGENVIQYIGIGTSIYFITRAAVQIPLGTLTDKIKKDKDEISFLLIGVILMGLTFALYPLISKPYHYFFLQFLFGFGASLNVTNWRKLFALNIEKGKEGFNYAFYETSISIATTLLSVLVGYVASLGEIYFDTVMYLSGAVMTLAGLWVALIYTIEKRKSRK